MSIIEPSKQSLGSYEPDQSPFLITPDGNYSVDLYLDPNVSLCTFPKRGKYLDADPDKLDFFIRSILDETCLIDSPEEIVEDVLLSFSIISQLDLGRMGLDLDLSNIMEVAEEHLAELDCSPFKGKELIGKLLSGALGPQMDANISKFWPYDGRYNVQQLRNIIGLELLERFASERGLKREAKKARKIIKNRSLTPQEKARRKALEEMLFRTSIVGASLVYAKVWEFSLFSGLEDPKKAKRLGTDVQPQREKRTISSEIIQKLPQEIIVQLSEIDKSIQLFTRELGLTHFPYDSIAVPAKLYAEIVAGRDPSKSKDGQLRGLFEILSTPGIRPDISYRREEETKALRTVLSEIASDLQIKTDDPSINIDIVRMFIEKQFAEIFPLAMLIIPDQLVLNHSQSAFTGGSIEVKLETFFPRLLNTLTHESGEALKDFGNNPVVSITRHPEVFSVRSLTEYYRSNIAALRFLTNSLMRYTPDEMFNLDFGANAIYYGRWLKNFTEEGRRAHLEKAAMVYEMFIRPNLSRDFRFQWDYFSGAASDFNLDMLLNFPPEQDDMLWLIVEKILVIGAICAIKYRRNRVESISRLQQVTKDSVSEIQRMDKIAEEVISSLFFRTLHQMMSIPDISYSFMYDANVFPPLVQAARYVHAQRINRDSIHPGVTNYNDLLLYLERRAPGSVVRRSW